MWNRKDSERGEQNLYLTFGIEMDTNDLPGEARASPVKVGVKLCSRRRGCSCFPVLLRVCILLVLCMYSKGNRKKTISKEAKILLPVGKGVSKDDKVLAK